MVLLKDILPIDLLNAHLENGVIRRQVHPKFPELFVYNYTEKAQYDRIWDAATNVCRGLIAAGDVVVARAFNKFHNLNTEYVPETMEASLPKEVPLVTMKLDGSLGIVYFYGDEWWVATRGSFDSDQARWATAWLRRNITLGFGFEDALVTPVTEIIYPENRIVVEYGWEGLVLLSIVRKDTGRELDRQACEDWATIFHFRIVDKFDKSLAECAAEDNPNEEGYVLTYDMGADVSPLKVKVKFAEYVRLHRILTGLNPKAIWELLAEKQESAVYLWLEDAKMPEGFKKWLSAWVTELQARYAKVEAEAKAVFAGKPGGTRKDDALYFLKTPHLKAVLFLMLDGKDYSGTIWDQIKPKATDTFKVEGE